MRPEGHQDKSKFGNLLENFKLVVEDTSPIVLSGGMHCETVLATLGKYSESFLSLEGDDNAMLTLTCKVCLLFTCLVLLSEHFPL